jgi:cytochrome oxidase assembly protein ShyY1
MTHELRKRGISFAIFTLVMVIAFASLGIWQLQRRVEKHALIAALNQRLAAEPVVLPPPSEWHSLKASTDEFRRVRLTAALIDPASSGRVYSSGSAVRDDISGPGKWEFMPARLPGGEIVVVNIGFAQDPAPNSSSGEARYTRFVVRIPPPPLTGYIRFPESAGLLTPNANVDQRLWFTRDHLAMARALGWDRDGKAIAPFYIDLESPALVPGVKPGPLHVRLKDDHMQYAITWFTLAGAVVIAFGVWWRAQRRN